MIRLEHITKRFGHKMVLDDVSLHVKPGENFFIVGLSGAGKSVTLKHIIGLLRPTAGRVMIGDQAINEAGHKELQHIRSRFGYLFQSAALLQWLSVGENVGLPLRELTKMPDAEIDRRAQAILEKVALPDAFEKYPAGISGGMQKRAGLARAIVTEPEIVLYDEPTSGLDPVTSRTIDELIDQLRQDLGITSVIVTHDMISALTIGTRIAMLHLGKLVEVSTPRDFLNSTDPTVRRFLKSQHIGPAFLDQPKD